MGVDGQEYNASLHQYYFFLTHHKLVFGFLLNLFLIRIG